MSWRYSLKLKHFILLIITMFFTVTVYIEQPQLSNGTDFRVEATTATTITVSFIKWDQTMIGGLAPDE